MVDNMRFYQEKKEVKYLFYAFLIGLFSFISANEMELKMPPQMPSIEQKAKTGFFYVRFAACEKDMIRADALLPGLGIGYRRLAGNGAADISVSGIGIAEKKNGRIFWTAPKTSYIHYLQPDQKQSYYLGGGLAWGGLESKGQSFIGIIPSFTGGYEFVRKSSVLGFAELNVSQPALAVYKRGAFPGVIAECTVGIGF